MLSDWRRSNVCKCWTCSASRGCAALFAPSFSCYLLGNKQRNAAKWCWINRAELWGSPPRGRCLVHSEPFAIWLTRLVIKELVDPATRRFTLPSYSFVCATHPRSHTHKRAHAHLHTQVHTNRPRTQRKVHIADRCVSRLPFLFFFGSWFGLLAAK